MKNRRRGLLCLLILLVLTGGAAESAFKRRRAEIQHMDREIWAGLIAVYPIMRERLRREFTSEALSNPTFDAFAQQNGNPYDWPFQPYSDGGNGASWVAGGVIDGPIERCRSVILDMPDPKADFSKLPLREDLRMVHLEIRAVADWRLFPGQTKLAISHDGSRTTRDFLDLLGPELKRRGIEPIRENRL